MKRFIAAGVVALLIAGGVGGVIAAGALSGTGSSTMDVGAQQTEQKAWLGVKIVQSPDGPTIAAVIADSPAEKAGLKRNDVIKSVDGNSVADPAAVRNTIENKKPGDTVTLSITRDGNAQDVTATLEARPEPVPQANPVFPKLNGIPKDQLFSHFLGGSFQFKDAAGSMHTATVDLGTVTAVDASAKTLTVNLNSGDSKTYNITSDVHIRPALSDFQNGDHVTAISVDGTLRAVTKGGHFLPFFGGEKHGGFRHHEGGRFDSEKAPEGTESSTSGGGL